MGVVVFTKVLGHAKSQSPRTLRVLGLSDFTSPWTFAKTTTPIYISRQCSTVCLISLTVVVRVIRINCIQAQLLLSTSQMFHNKVIAAMRNYSSAVGGKTGKMSILPGFSKIELGGGSGVTLHCFVGLSQSGLARHASGAARLQSLAITGVLLIIPIKEPTWRQK